MMDAIELLSKVVSIITGFIAIINFLKGKNFGFWLFIFILSGLSIFFVSKLIKPENMPSDNPIVKYQDFDNVDGDYSKFRIKFYEDYAFQISRIKFPLKTTPYGDHPDGSESEPVDSELTKDNWKEKDVHQTLKSAYKRDCSKTNMNELCFFDLKFYDNNNVAIECFSMGNFDSATECMSTLKFEKIEGLWYLIAMD